MRLSTTVTIEKPSVRISLEDRITVLGSCFSDEIGARLLSAGFNACVNPFGPLYNPMSISRAVERLDTCTPFTENDCVEVGAGSTLVCSHWHHTSFARDNAEEFLENANRSLKEAGEAWKNSNKVLITLGTAFIWCLLSNGEAVANCLKRPGKEFSRRMISSDEVCCTVKRIIDSHPDKEFIFTVSPIRHLGDGAHKNNLSKSTLLIGLDKALEESGQACYFPSYEIVLDELRDYRFFSDDMVHPSNLAVSVIWEKFTEAFIPESEWEKMKENERFFKSLKHRPIR